MTHLYPFVGHRVATPVGAGWLWQVFRDRIGVVLDVMPNKVVFLADSSAVTRLSDHGEKVPWHRPRVQEKKVKWRQPATFFGLDAEEEVV